MNSKKVAVFFLAALLIGVVLLYALGTAQKQGEKLVVYNGFAYYEQAARVSGPDAQFELPEGVERDSISLRLATGYVVSQHIKDANQTTESDLLKSYIGKEVSIFDENGREIKGILLKYDAKAYVKTAEGLYVIDPSYYVLPGFDGNMSEENASIMFKINATQTDAKLSYLVDSISWSPIYALYLSGNGGTLSLYGHVRNYARDYDNVSLSLFYGQVKKSAYGGYYYPYYDYAKGATPYEGGASSLPGSYQPTAVSEYYKFDLGDVALPLGETEYNLMERNANRVKKTYEMSIGSYYYGTDSRYSSLEIMLAINNSQANGLGAGGLPSGKIRVMDKDGFVGESYVSETPNNEEMKFSIGNAFDVIGMSKLVNQTEDLAISCDPHIMEARYAPLCINEKGYIYATTYEYEATVKNKKSEGVDVVLTYNPYGDWVIVSESMPSEKVSQNEVKWRFAMPANSEKTLRFTITVKSRGSYPYPLYDYTEGQSLPA